MSDSERRPYTDEEAVEARLWVGRHGPSNSWTATNGTAARMIGRLLDERQRLIAELQERPAVSGAPRPLHDGAPLAGQSAYLECIGISGYYARRSGYFQGALEVIASGYLEDPEAGAKRVLESAGDDAMAKRLDRMAKPSR